MNSNAIKLIYQNKSPQSVRSRDTSNEFLLERSKKVKKSIQQKLFDSFEIEKLFYFITSSTNDAECLDALETFIKSGALEYIFCRFDDEKISRILEFCNRNIDKVNFTGSIVYVLTNFFERLDLVQSMVYEDFYLKLNSKINFLFHTNLQIQNLFENFIFINESFVRN